MTARRRRSPGEGSVFKYETRARVTRYGIKFDAPSADAKRRQVMRRRDANGQPGRSRSRSAALRELSSRPTTATGSSRASSLSPLTWPLARWLAPRAEHDGQLQENFRLHVVPYIGRAARVADFGDSYRAVPRAGNPATVTRKGQRTGAPLSMRTVRGVAIHARRGPRRLRSMTRFRCWQGIRPAKSTPPTPQGSGSGRTGECVRSEPRASSAWFLGWAKGARARCLRAVVRAGAHRYAAR